MKFSFSFLLRFMFLVIPGCTYYTVLQCISTCFKYCFIPHTCHNFRKNETPQAGPWKVIYIVSSVSKFRYPWFVVPCKHGLHRWDCYIEHLITGHLSRMIAVRVMQMLANEKRWDLAASHIDCHLYSWSEQDSCAIYISLLQHVLIETSARFTWTMNGSMCPCADYNC